MIYIIDPYSIKTEWIRAIKEEFQIYSFIVNFTVYVWIILFGFCGSSIARPFDRTFCQIPFVNVEYNPYTKDGYSIGRFKSRVIDVASRAMRQQGSRWSSLPYIFLQHQWRSINNIIRVYCGRPYKEGDAWDTLRDRTPYPRGESDIPHRRIHQNFIKKKKPLFCSQNIFVFPWVNFR